MGVTAFADATAVYGSSMSATGASTAATIEIHGVSITLQATANSNDVEMAATRQSVIAAINAVSDQTGVVASDGGNENGVILTAEDGRNIVLEGTGGNLTTAFGLATATTTAGASSSSLSGGQPPIKTELLVALKCSIKNLKGKKHTLLTKPQKE